MAADERRLQLIKIAMQLFSQRGFRGTTTKEIANAAGVSEAMVFRHFATKHELYAAIIDHKACTTELGVDPCEHFGELIESKDDRAVFYNLALDILQHHEEDTEFMRLLLSSALENHELAEMFFERYIVNFHRFLTAYVEQRQADGAFRDLNAAVIVRAFIGMAIHHSINNTLWDKHKRLLQITNEEAARQFTEILLGGVKLNDEGKRTQAKDCKNESFDS